MLGLYRGYWESEQGPHACASRTLPAASSAAVMLMLICKLCSHFAFHLLSSSIPSSTHATTLFIHLMNVFIVSTSWLLHIKFLGTLVIKYLYKVCFHLF